jgi:hypothetical protein
MLPDGERPTLEENKTGFGLLNSVFSTNDPQSLANGTSMRAALMHLINRSDEDLNTNIPEGMSLRRLDNEYNAFTEVTMTTKVPNVAGELVDQEFKFLVHNPSGNILNAYDKASGKYISLTGELIDGGDRAKENYESNTGYANLARRLDTPDQIIFACFLSEIVNDAYKMNSGNGRPETPVVEEELDATPSPQVVPESESTVEIVTTTNN